MNSKPPQWMAISSWPKLRKRQEHEQRMSASHIYDIDSNMGQPLFEPRWTCWRKPALDWDPGLFSVPMVLIHPHFFMALPIDWVIKKNLLWSSAPCCSLTFKTVIIIPTEYGTILENPVSVNYPLIRWLNRDYDNGFWESSLKYIV